MTLFGYISSYCNVSYSTAKVWRFFLLKPKDSQKSKSKDQTIDVLGFYLVLSSNVINENNFIKLIGFPCGLIVACVNILIEYDSFNLTPCCLNIIVFLFF